LEQTGENEITVYLFSSHEQQVFYRVRDARHIFRIAEASHIHIQGGACLIRASIVDQKSL
jgi:hypothetical protein